MEKVPCPHCGEPNVLGSNICGRCLRNIREWANPEREDFISTARSSKKYRRRSLWMRLRRWWNRLRGRGADSR